MYKFIVKLRGAPEDVKKTFAVGVAGFITFIIVFTSYMLFNPLRNQPKKVEAKENLVTPFSSISSLFTESFGGLKNDIGALPIRSLVSTFIGQQSTTTTEALTDSATSTTEDIAIKTNTISMIATSTIKK